MNDKCMRVVSVNASSSYNIYIGNGIIDRAGELCDGITPGCRIMIVSDDTVAALYLDRVRAVLERAGYRCASFVFMHGEESKCAGTYLSLLDELAAGHFDRGDALLALGGGVVGDLTGFAAATYMRGVRFVGVPTTLLSCVDSSVGGKTAIDIPRGKNLVGAFWQPSAVIIDPELLGTLPDEYFSDGMAEVIKYAMIRDASLMELISGGRARENIIDVIERCVSIKRDVVCEDERDTGVRAILNFGHTPAHAIEAASRFGVSHGRAVGIGMVMVTRASVEMGLCDRDTLDALCAVLGDYRLDTCCS